MNWANFFTLSPDPSLILTSDYSAGLVILSFLISISCSAVFFYIVEVAKNTLDPVAKRVAVLSGSLTLGCGVWAMHFIGMLALRLCAEVSYDILITMISVAPSMLASYLAIDLFINKAITPTRLIVSGTLVGAGIGAMHYTGMQAMVMAPYLRYQPSWFLLSVVVAVVLAIASLGLASHNFFKQIKAWQRIVLGGTVLGCAVCFMHYLGMKSAVFIGIASTPVPIFPDGASMLALIITLGIFFVTINGIGLNIFKYREIAQVALKENEAQQALIKELKEMQQQLLQAEKMASVGQLAAGIAHEINNPVSFVNSNMNALKRYVTTLIDVIDQYKRFLLPLSLNQEQTNIITNIDKNADLEFIYEDVMVLLAESLEGLKRVKDIVQSLKDMAHVDTNAWGDADIHHGLDSTLRIINNEIKYKAKVIKNYGDIPRVKCIIAQLNQVFMNLFINAAHAIEETGTITVSTGIETKDGKEWVWIKISDTGSGIAPENLSRIFDPFFTTKPIGSGTGLGLSLSYGIVKGHDGYIDVESEVGKGSCFSVYIPIQDKQPVKKSKRKKIAVETI